MGEGCTLELEGEGVAEGERRREKSSERLPAAALWLGSGGVLLLANGDGPAAAALAAWLCASKAACCMHAPFSKMCTFNIEQARPVYTSLLCMFCNSTLACWVWWIAASLSPFGQDSTASTTCPTRNFPLK